MSFVWTWIAILLNIFTFFLIARLVLDYVQMFARSWRPTGVVLVLAEIIYSITDPPLKVLRKFIPPLKIGTISLDLSFLVLIILVQVLARIATVLASN
jgi:YggT family protein